MSEVFPNANRFPKINDAEIYIGNVQKRPISNPISGDATIDNTGKLTIPNILFAKVIKTVDEILSNNNALQPDNELFVSLNANTRYGYLLFLFIKSDSVPDFQYSFAKPTNAVGRYLSGTWSGGLSSATADITSTTAIFVNNASTKCTCITGFITVKETAGDFELLWSQRNSNSEDTEVLEGSSMLVWKE